MIYKTPYNQKRMEMEGDVCIIGSGAGGGVCAKRLQSAGLKVIVIEEGPYIKPHEFSDDPLTAFKMLYRNCGIQFAQGKVFFPILTGKCVGGTTTINSAICMRPPEEILLRWSRDFLIPTLSPNSIYPHVEMVEKEIKITPADMSVGGKNNALFKKGIERLGWRGGPILRNAPECQGCGVCIFGCPIGAKLSTDLTYIPEASDIGAEIFPLMRAEGFIIEGNSVNGVKGKILSEDDEEEGSFEVRAKVVILATGTLVSPILLLKNGIKSSPAIGNNLTVHPASGVLAIFREDVNLWEGIPGGYYCDEFIGDGILIETSAVDPAVIFAYISNFRKENEKYLKSIKKIGLAGAMVYDLPSGYVKLGKGIQPIIAYQLREDAFKLLLKAMESTAKIMFSAGAEMVKPLFTAAPFFSDMEKLREFFGSAKIVDIEMEGNHPMGTLRMGISSEVSAVDPSGRVHGLKGLFVADASVFPSALSVNPMLTIMAIASRLSQEILKEF